MGHRTRVFWGINLAIFAGAQIMPFWEATDRGKPITAALFAIIFVASHLGSAKVLGWFK